MLQYKHMQEDITLSPIQAFFRNKWVRLCLLFDILLIIILIGILIWQSTKVSTIIFNITPLNSKITIGNEQYENGQYAITPGTYTVTISHDDLATKSFTVNISPQSVTTITTFLSDNSKTFDFYKQKANYMSYKKLEEIASADNNITTDDDHTAETFITNFNEQYALIENSLPIRYTSYEHDVDGWDSLTEQIIIIRPDEDDSCSKTLCVKALMGLNDNKKQVDIMLKEKNINTEEVEIIYEKD